MVCSRQDIRFVCSTTSRRRSTATRCRTISRRKRNLFAEKCRIRPPSVALSTEWTPSFTWVQQLVLASSMSIYGEGKYLCAQCGDVAPQLRSNEQLRAKDWEMACPACGEALTPIPTDESKPLQCSSIYALSKKDQEEMTLLF